jgi:hypothetical protein
MPRQKGPAKRKGSTKKDLVTVPYGMVIYYVVIGLIIGMAIGALTLLYIARLQNQYEASLNDTSAQLLQYSRIR